MNELERVCCLVFSPSPPHFFFSFRQRQKQQQQRNVRAHSIFVQAR